MVEGTPIVHVNLVITLEMLNKGWDVPSDRALKPSIWAVVWMESTLLLVLELAVVWKDIMTT